MIQRVAELAVEAVPACSALSVLEVELGVKDGEETATRSFLNAMNVESVDEGVASPAARIIRKHRRRGITLDFVDAVIAATCLLRGFELATFNRSHYPMPGIDFAPL